MDLYFLKEIGIHGKQTKKILKKNYTMRRKKPAMLKLKNATLRQILEHRRADAPCDEDFRRSDHGPVVRMFARSPFARCFGAAGFDRHLLHHWEPTGSYTCFDEMEAFLERTALAGPLADARSTYGATLSEMIRSARNAPTV